MKKTLKKTLSIILAILMIVATIPVVFAADRTITIEMADQYSDGWNGAYISINMLNSDGDDVFVDSATVVSGTNTNTFEAVYSDEDIYYLCWHSGRYDNECSFTIKVDGKEVLSVTNARTYFSAAENNIIIYPFCEHEYSDGRCIACNLVCSHVAFTDRVCDECGYFCNHEGQLRSPCKVCGSEFHVCSDKNFDEVCDGCGTETKIKIITSENNVIYVDGELSDGELATGSYRLGGDVISNTVIVINEDMDVAIDLAGYQWTFLGYSWFYLYSDLSIYDTSAEQSGKIVSEFTIVYSPPTSGFYPTFSLYGGSLETTTDWTTIEVIGANAKLYNGSLKSKTYPITYAIESPTVIDIDNVTLEYGEGYAHINIVGTAEPPFAVIDVSDYKGDGLLADYTTQYFSNGKYTVFTGIANAEEAEKYVINLKKIKDVDYLAFQKIEYDEETGTKGFYMAPNAFTQQPSAENNYEALFSHSLATLQWYEVEEKYSETYTVTGVGDLFEYEVSAGDVLILSTESDLNGIDVYFNSDYVFMYQEYRTKVHFFNADETVKFCINYLSAENPVELKFTILSANELDGETDSMLNQVECGKSYKCKAYVSENHIYFSDTIEGHTPLVPFE